MKRSEMVKDVAVIVSEVTDGDLEITDDEASEILRRLEVKGMTPPPVSEEDKQALMSVYYAGYTFHQWDEDLAKDDKVQEAKSRRADAKLRRDEYLEKHGTLRGFLSTYRKPVKPKKCSRKAKL